MRSTFFCGEPAPHSGPEYVLQRFYGSTVFREIFPKRIIGERRGRYHSRPRGRGLSAGSKPSPRRSTREERRPLTHCRSFSCCSLTILLVSMATLFCCMSSWRSSSRRASAASRSSSDMNSSRPCRKWAAGSRQGLGRKWTAGSGPQEVDHRK